MPFACEDPARYGAEEMHLQIRGREVLIILQQRHQREGAGLVGKRCEIAAKDRNGVHIGGIDRPVVADAARLQHGQLSGIEIERSHMGRRLFHLARLDALQDISPAWHYLSVFSLIAAASASMSPRPISSL